MRVCVASKFTVMFEILKESVTSKLTCVVR